MSKTQWRSIGLVLAFTLGATLHAQLAPLRGIIPYSIALMLFLSFIGIEREKLRPQRSHLLLLLLLQLGWITAWGIPYLLGYRVLSESLFFCAAAPIASASPVIIALIRGKVEYMTTAMLLSHVAFILIIPLVLPFIIETGGTDMSYWMLLTQLFQEFALLLLLPSSLVILTRYLIPSSREWGKKNANLSLIIWIFNLTVITATGTQNILAMNLSFYDLYPMALGAFIICALGFTLGYQLGKPHYAREFSQGLGQKNTILTLYIASQSYAHPLAYVAPAFYVIFHNLANAIQIALANKDAKVRKIENQ